MSSLRTSHTLINIHPCSSWHYSWNSASHSLLFSWSCWIVWHHVATLSATWCLMMSSKSYVPSTIPPSGVHQAKWLPYNFSISSHNSLTTVHCTPDHLSVPPMFRLVNYVIQPSLVMHAVLCVKCKMFVPSCLYCRQPPFANSSQVQPPLRSSAFVLHSFTITITIISTITIIGVIAIAAVVVITILSIFFISSHQIDSWTFVRLLCFCLISCILVWPVYYYLRRLHAALQPQHISHPAHQQHQQHNRKFHLLHCLRRHHHHHLKWNTTITPMLQFPTPSQFYLRKKNNQRKLYLIFISFYTVFRKKRKHCWMQFCRYLFSACFANQNVPFHVMHSVV